MTGESGEGEGRGTDIVEMRAAGGDGRVLGEASADEVVTRCRPLTGWSNERFGRDPIQEGGASSRGEATVGMLVDLSGNPAKNGESKGSYVDLKPVRTIGQRERQWGHDLLKNTKFD